MENNKYQEEASKTIPSEEDYLSTTFTTNDKMILNALMGLSGETGELIDLFKKAYFQGHQLDKEEAVKEIGDVFWYLNLLCKSMYIDFSDVMQKNIDKLRKRYGEQFSSEKSVNREEYQK